MEEQFRALAGTLVATIAKQGVALDYDAASVEWVDGFIERQRARFPGAEADGLVNVIGAFLGECIIRNFGGRWRESEGSWGVFFEGDTAAFPFAKVRKQFDHGREGGDSIRSFYEVIPVILRRAQDAD